MPGGHTMTRAAPMRRQYAASAFDKLRLTQGLLMPGARIHKPTRHDVALTP
jgi:hypothetical protein